MGFNELDARQAVLGYGIMRCIMVANPLYINKETLHAFLILLATFERCYELTGPGGLWESVLEIAPSQPSDNWGALGTALNRIEIWARQNFGIEFRPPSNTSWPWEIYTWWPGDLFMQVLLAVRPSQASLRNLLAYADILICTRFAASPLPEIRLPGQPDDRMYYTPFTAAPPTQGAFLSEEAEMMGENSGDMDVDPSAPAESAPDNTGA